MTFLELTRIMLSSMDFFELRRTAARYGVAYQGVRRSKLLRELEKKITSKNIGQAEIQEPTTPNITTVAASPELKAASETTGRKNKGMKINTYIAGTSQSRTYGR